jgi:hypothetical protein
VDIGPILIVLGVLALVPAFLIGGLVFSAILGWLETTDAEARNEGSELIDLNT